MARIQKFLKSRRKAELQTLHQFWFPGESVLTGRALLEKRIAEALSEGTQLEEKLGRLSRSQRSLLSLVLAQPDFVADRVDVNARLAAQGVLPFEVDTAARMLEERGFLQRLRSSAAKSGTAQDTFEVPQELGQRLESLLDIDTRSVQPGHQISQRRLPFEVDFEGLSLEERVAAIEDARLRKVVQIAIARRGIAGIRADCDEVLHPRRSSRRNGKSRRKTEPTQDNNGSRSGADEALLRQWREAVERAGIGTIGNVSLKDFGILVEEPSVVIFQEWIHRSAVARQCDIPEPDTLLEAGVDLYIDLERVAMRFEDKPVTLTRDGRVPKRTVESLRATLCLERIGAYLEGDMTEAVVQVARRVGILESYAGMLQVHSERLRVWRKLDLTHQVASVLKYFLSESQGGRWSFHQELLRSVLIDCLRQDRPDGWLSLEAIVTQAVSTYMLELEEREVRDMLRQRREEDFGHERLNSPFHRLGSDLVYWIVHRFLPLGVCELGIVDGHLRAFRLTALGRELLGLPVVESENRILVNPNFEIILFCEGLEGMRLELALSRFGERISAERIRRYRISRDSIRDGIRSGLSLAEIRTLLSGASEHPLPDPVLVALQDWGNDLDWVEVVPAVVLRGLKSRRARALSEDLTRHGVAHQLTRDGRVVLAPFDEGCLEQVLEKLRESGWLIRHARDEHELEDLNPRRS